MNNPSLAALLDDDREMIIANLNRDRALPAAQASLEKAVDRVMYRYTEQAETELLRDSAQHILQAMKNALPMIDAVGEARAWKRELPKAKQRGLRMTLWPSLLLVLGALLVIASVLAVMISGKFTGALTFVKALLPVALGCGALGIAVGRRNPRAGLWALTAGAGSTLPSARTCVKAMPGLRASPGHGSRRAMPRIWSFRMKPLTPWSAIMCTTIFPVTVSSICWKPCAR